MKNSMRKAAILVLSLFAAILISDLNVSYGGGHKDERIKIGAIAPLTGPFAAGGNAFMKSLSIAEEQVNERGGVFARKIVLLKGDSEGLVSRARNEALRLIEKEKVDFLIGAYLSEETMGVIEVAAKYGIIIMIPISATNEITDLVKKDYTRYRYVFRTGYSITRWASMIGGFINGRGYSRYTFIGSQIRWNRELRNSLKKYLGERDIHEISADFYSPKKPSIKPIVLRIKDAAPQIIVVGDPGKNSVEVIKSLTSINYNGPVISVGGTLADRRVVKDLKPTFELFSLASCYTGSSEHATEYFSKFEKRGGYIPSGYSDTLPGDALTILAEAINRAGTLDGNRIIEELERGKFPGAAGTYTFDSNHQANWGASTKLTGAVIRWRGTSFELIYPEK